MELVKRFVDVGIFTNRLDEMRAFYGERIRLPYEELLPVGGGVRQYRYGLLGSVLKINHTRDPLPARVAGGYRKLSISDPRTPMPLPLQDPDGNDIELVPQGQRNVSQIEIHLGVTDEAAFEHFYGDALGAERLGQRRFKLGETIVSVRQDPAAVRGSKSPAGSAIDVMATMRAVGMRYITVQVRDCDAEHRRLMSMGVWEGAAPVTLGTVARISFIRDPDGNFIEISQRASLTGPIPG
ncbi:MAG TPA: VOC family protein [Candidatus Acidoferrum sp.]|jgi:lactoylglutathione lyase|nr:VOC family protein [Candidatus Acidoferrum sp.]